MNDVMMTELMRITERTLFPAGNAISPTDETVAWNDTVSDMQDAVEARAAPVPVQTGRKSDGFRRKSDGFCRTADGCRLGVNGIREFTRRDNSPVRSRGVREAKHIPTREPAYREPVIDDVHDRSRPENAFSVTENGSSVQEADIVRAVVNAFRDGRIEVVVDDVTGMGRIVDRS